MKKRKAVVIFIVVIMLVAVVVFAARIDAPIIPADEDSQVLPQEAPASKDDLIVLTSPLPRGAIASPLVITGKARGNWYFEASFPIVLTDWDGRIIAEGHAEAQGDWMTTEYVPFIATLTFVKPDTSVSDRGYLILKKDNPSDDPKFDNALEVEVHYQ